LWVIRNVGGFRIPNKRNDDDSTSTVRAAESGMIKTCACAQKFEYLCVMGIGALALTHQWNSLASASGIHSKYRDKHVLSKFFAAKIQKPFVGGGGIIDGW